MTRWSDIDRTLDMMDELRRRMNWLVEQDGNRTRDGWQAFYEDADRPLRGRGANVWPPFNLFDAGSNLVVKADVPGLTEKDLRLTIHQDVLTVSGARASDGPEGYSTHRKERAPAKFSRSFTLPCKVDVERTSATVKNGVLTITLAKVPEAQPRQIHVQAR